MNTPHSPAGRRALVMGLGRFGGGLGAARWLADAGAQVVVTDTAPAEQLAASVAQLAPWVERGSVALHLGGHRAEDFESAEWVIANPAVRPDSPWLARARAAGARLTSEVELYLERTTAQVVAVTGTQGKSSTVTFTAALLRAAGRTAAAGGNLGGSLLEALSFERPGQVRVVELSSYQLEALSPTPPARVAALAVTNVLADHLDRHGDLAGYAAAKARILELAAPGALCLLPSTGPASDLRPPRGRRLSHGPGGDVHWDAQHFYLEHGPLGCPAALALPPFQRANVLVALTLARSLGAAPEALLGELPRLSPPAHRVEALPPVRGRRVADNGVATTPDATLGALDGLEAPVTLLCGGQSKGLDWRELAERCAARGDRVVTFGASEAELSAAFAAAGAPVERGGALEAAVELALGRTPRGALLLFSPSCASFDAFENFSARARAFRAVLDRQRELAPLP